MSTQTLSGGRAGAGSVVSTDEAVARTVVVAGVGTVQTAATASAPTQTIRVMVLA